MFAVFLLMAVSFLSHSFWEDGEGSVDVMSHVRWMLWVDYSYMG